MITSNTKPYLYDAFISYRHTEPDKIIAIKLQKLLEAYKPPKDGTYENTPRIRKVFRDESELPTSGDLGADIKRALEQSAFLIVVCSENTPKSPWCMQEISYFKKLHHGQNDRILALLVDGDPKKAFPEELCIEYKSVRYPDGREELQKTEIEPLAANVTAKSRQASLKKLKIEFLRIAAPILGCGFDDLYRRQQRRFVRKVISLSAAIMAVLLSFSAFIYSQYMKIDQQSAQILTQKSEIEKAYGDLETSNLELQKTNEALEQTNDKLTTQIEETNRQKDLAEENRKEAEKQAKLAQENEQTALLNEQQALQNLQYANEQKELALANENKAVTNLSMAQEQQLFRTVQYAEQLVADGDRVQAAAILKEANSRFSKSSPRYSEFVIKLEAASAKVAYYPAYSPYLKLDEEGFQIQAAAFSEDDRYFAVSDWYTITIRNTSDGDIVRTFSHEGITKCLYIKENYLIAAISFDLYIWNIEDGELVYHDDRHALQDMKTILCSNEMDAIILSNNFNIVILPYPWITGEKTDARLWDFSFSHGNISDNGRYAVSSDGRSINEQKVTVLDFSRFSPALNEEENLKEMAIPVVPAFPLYHGDYRVNNEGIVYYKTFEKPYPDMAWVYRAILYDIGKQVEVASMEIGVGDNLLLQNDWDGKTVVLGYGNARWIDLKSDAADKPAVRTDLRNFPQNYNINLIPGADQVLLSEALSKSNGEVYRLDGTKIAVLGGLSSRIVKTEVSHDGGTIFACSDDGMMILYKIKSGFSHQTPLKNVWDGYGSACIADNGIFHDRNGGERFRDLKSGQTVSEISFSSEVVDYSIFSAFSEDNRLAFGCEYNDSGFRAYRIWDVSTGKVINSLSFLGDYDVMAYYGMSPDFRYLIRCLDETLSVYSIEAEKEIYQYDFKQFMTFDTVGVENDGCTAWILDKANFRVIDVKKGEVINSLNLQFTGEYVYDFAVNLVQNRLHLIYMSRNGESFNTGSAIYTKYSDEPLIQVSSLVEGDSWKYSSNARLLYAYGVQPKSGSLVTIPDFETIRADSDRLAGNRVLNTAERQLCGLSIFD